MMEGAIRFAGLSLVNTRDKCAVYLAEKPITGGLRVLQVQLDRAQRKQQLTLIAKLEDQVAISEHFMWPEGKNLFDTSTSHLCRL